ncbi:hypothetical protein [Rhizobium sp. PAMB 3182]
MRYNKLLRLEKADTDLSFFFEHYARSVGKADCKSQLGQDIFALMVNNGKRGGFFVEFGATNGIRLSNTYLLEKRFGWTGILAEPANIWHAELQSNRAAAIEFDCVWTKSGETLDFEIIEQGAGLSTISRFSGSDKHVEARKTA